MDDTQSAPRAKAVSRRTVLRLGSAALAGAATGPFVVTPGHGQTFNWQRFKGKELFCLFYKHPWVDEMVKHIPEFESMTGIKVNYEVLPEVQGRQKLTVEMTGGWGGVDGWHASIHVEKRRFWKSGWYQPINKFLEDKTLTPPDFDWNDITPGASRRCSSPTRRSAASRRFVDPFVLFYRKDLFQQKGLEGAQDNGGDGRARPRSSTPPPTMYGFVYRGLKNANATPWAYMLFAMGGDYLKDGKSAINTPGVDRRRWTLRGHAPAVRPAGRRELQLVRVLRRLHAGPGGHLLRRGQLREPVRGPGEVEDRREGRLRRPAVRARRPPHLHVHERDGRLLPEQEQGGGVPLLLWSTNKQNACASCWPAWASGAPRPGANAEVKAKPKMPQSWYDAYLRLAEDREARPPRDRGRDPVPRHHRRRDPEGDRGHRPRRRRWRDAHKDFQDLLNRTEG